MTVNIIATGSKGNCYIIDDGNSRIMIDPGIPFKKIMEKSKHTVSRCECCLISHEHGDHVRGVEGVSKYISIVSTQETLDVLSEKYKLTMILPIVHKKPILFNTIRVTAFPVKHNAANPSGYHLKSMYNMEELVFITDSQYLGYRFPTAKHMVIECNYDEEILAENVESGAIEPFLANRIRSNHHSVDTLIKALAGSPNVENLYLIHNSSVNLDINKAIVKIKLSYKGKIITHKKEMNDENNTNS